MPSQKPSAFKNAIAFAQRGYPVLPVYGIVGPSFSPGEKENVRRCACASPDCSSPGKHPIAALVPHGLKDASTTVDKIKFWRSAFPNCNFGLTTGDLVVLDQDGPDGATSLNRLARDYRMPNTWTVSTGRLQSRHYYFRCPENVTVANSAGRLGKGLDLRGHGGYVVIPGSLHISGHRYTWWKNWHPQQKPVAKLPRWLLKEIQTPKKTGNGGKARQINEWRKLAAAQIESGCRNDTLARLAGLLLSNPFNDIGVVHELLQAWNTAHCMPPLSEREVEHVVASIAERESRKAMA
jgi:hypothetical protein